MSDTGVVDLFLQEELLRQSYAILTMSYEVAVAAAQCFNQYYKEAVAPALFCADLLAARPHLEALGQLVAGPS